MSQRMLDRKQQYGGTGAATSVDSHPGPRDASVVRSARAKACHHRRCQSDARGRLTPCVPLPIPQRQLKKKSTTSPCLEMVGYVVTARNPVPRISLYLLYPKRGLRFGWIVRPRRNPFAPLEPPAFVRNFWFSAPPASQASREKTRTGAQLRGPVCVRRPGASKIKLGVGCKRGGIRRSLFVGRRGRMLTGTALRAVATYPTIVCSLEV